MPGIFAERVDIRLGELGWNRSDLARKLKVKRTGVYKVLNEGRTPRPATVAKWAKALITTPEWLLGKPSELPDAEIEVIERIIVTSALPAEKIQTLRAVLWADEKEVLLVRAAAGPILERLGSGKKDQRSG